jgi:drug/metabolite transporter (DMT)-like permease
MADHRANVAIRGLGPMGKAMSVAGMVVGGLLAVMFLADLFLKIPFGGPARGSALTDIGLAICGGILAYLGWNAFREAK